MKLAQILSFGLLMLLMSAWGYSQESISPDDGRLLSTYSEGPADGYSWRQRPISYARNDGALSTKKLLSTQWVMDPVTQPWMVLVFFADGVFKFGSYQGGVALFGNYEIINSRQLRLSKDQGCLQRDYAGFSGASTVLTFDSGSQNFFYSHALGNAALTFYACGSEQPEGTAATFAGIKVIREQRELVACDNVNVRLAPGTKSALLGYSLYDFSFDVKAGLLLKGSVVRCIGRSAQTETIQGQTASWNLVVIGLEESVAYAWVFGAWLDDCPPADKEKAAEILAKELAKYRRAER